MTARIYIVASLLFPAFFFRTFEMSAAPGWNSLGSGLNGTVNAILVNGSDVYVGGAFTNAGGIAAADYVARWNGSAWQAVAAGLNAPVNCLALDDNGNLYAGGRFTDAGGNPNADYVSYWDGGSWQALGQGLGNWVWAIGISGSDVYVGGDFANAGGLANADYIARWDGNSWYAMDAGPGNWVRGIAISGGNVYVTGGFFNTNGNPDADGIVRWDGSAWHALGTGGMTYWAHAVAISGNNVFVGGGFYEAGGNPNANFIARFDGTSWHALGASTSYSVFAIALDGNNVYAGGSFISAGGNNNAKYVGRWDGSTWNALNTGLNNAVFAASIQNNSVYVGGDFTNAGGNNSADYIARWENSAAPVELARFTVRHHLNGALLEWETQTEWENDYFWVEHSTNGADFRPLEKIAGQGTSHEPHQYSAYHNSPASGLNYYRLKQFDFDGTFSISNIVTLASTADPELTLTPNPAPGYARLNGIIRLPARIRIISLSGQTLLEKEIYVPDHWIDLSHCPPGCHAVEISDRVQQWHRWLIIE